MTDATLNDKATAAASRADSDVQDGVRGLTETADQVKKVVADKAGVARDWALDQSDVIRDTVQTRPFISVGVAVAAAFAAGLVLGVLLTQD